MVTHPSIDQAHGCLTSVIGPWMVAPCQWGSFWLIFGNIWSRHFVGFLLLFLLSCDWKITRKLHKILHITQISLTARLSSPVSWYIDSSLRSLSTGTCGSSFLVNTDWSFDRKTYTWYHPKAHIHEIWWISPWNLADFTQISPVKSTQNYKSKCFSKNSSVWWMQGGGYDQGFHEIHQIWPVKSTQIIKASVSAKTLQFDECRVGAMTKDFMKSTRFDLWNPPKL